MSGIVVTLGAGHGGHDLGTVGPSGLAEKDFTLAAARQAARWLAAGPFEPALLRAGDWCVDTPQRARMTGMLRSRCHVELHADLSPGSPKGAAVWFSAYRPGDRLPAAELSRRIARVCRVPDCGARPRYDYGTLLSLPPGAEDYYAVLEQTAGPESGPARAFYCECGLPERTSVSAERLRRAAARLAWETARAVAALFGAGFGARLRPPPEREVWNQAVCPVRLRAGLFYARMCRRSRKGWKPPAGTASAWCWRSLGPVRRCWEPWGRARGCPFSGCQAIAVWSTATGKAF